jgi:hypothetical protein
MSASMTREAGYRWAKGMRVRGEAELRKRKAAKLPSESRPGHHLFSRT